MKNYTKLFLLVTIFTLALSCTGKRGVPEGFDEAIVNSVIEKTITLVSERNYDEVVKLFAPVMSSLNLETFAKCSTRYLIRLEVMRKLIRLLLPLSR